jgi:hypothetical protein
VPAIDLLLKIPEHVIARKVGEETVMLNLDSGMYYGLDATGSRFFELLETHDRLQAIVDIMSAEFEVSRQQLETDLLELAGELKKSGLLALS